MKGTITVLVALLPALVLAEEPLMSGFSNSIESPQLSEARQQLERQGQSGGPEESELSAQLYVDSQARMAETFRRPVPDTMTQQTRSEN